MNSSIERPPLPRDVEDVVRRIGRHRAMLVELVRVQLQTLLELKDLVARSGAAVPPEPPLPDIDAEIHLASRIRGLISAEARVPNRSTPKVLLVDDDPTTRNLVSHFLRKEDFIVIKASDGNDGLARAKKDRPDLLIVDTTVAGMDGFELVSLLKREPETRGLPVLMLSSLNDEEAIVKSLDAGADYVIKPFSPRILVAMIKRILRDVRDHAVDHRPL